MLRRFQEQRAVQQAKEFAARKDVRSATLSARQALMLNPTNLAACELMASLAEAARVPQWLEWRQKIADLAPTTDNKLQLAAASLLVEGAPWSIAARTLAELSEAGKQLPRFHVLSAQLALNLKQPLPAEVHFTEAVRLDPTNESYQLNLAVLRLSSTNLIVRSQSQATLERLADHSELRSIALRSLISDALSRTNLPRAEALSSRLASDSRAQVADQLQYLGILQMSCSAAFGPALSNFQAQVQTNADAVQLVSTWLINRGMAREALTWLTNCPAGTKQQQPVRLALSDCFMALRNWTELESQLEQEKWGDLESIRLALLSKCASERHDEVAANAQWRLAVHQAGGKLPALQGLLNLSTRWGRLKEREDLLWQIAEKFPRERWVCQDLTQLYTASGNTRALNRLYSTLLTSDSSDVVARNNLAATSLLLQINLPKAHELARINYQQQPDEPVIASTYAFSLYLQGYTKEGLAIFEKLPPEQRRDRIIALYYALLLNADGQSRKAAEVAAAIPQANLLPEERTLLAQVRNGGA